MRYIWLTAIHLAATACMTSDGNGSSLRDETVEPLTPIPAGFDFYRFQYDAETKNCRDRDGVVGMNVIPDITWISPQSGAQRRQFLLDHARGGQCLEFHGNVFYRFKDIPTGFDFRGSDWTKMVHYGNSCAGCDLRGAKLRFGSDISTVGADLRDATLEWVDPFDPTFDPENQTHRDAAASKLRDSRINAGTTMPFGREVAERLGAVWVD